MSILRLTHIGICVADMERSLRFYRDLLGFNYLSRLDVEGEPSNTLLELPDVKLRAEYLERDGTRIELLHYASPGAQGDGSTPPMNRLGLTHLSLRVENLEQLLKELAGAGVRVLESTNVYNPHFQAGAIFITDPDGTRIELVAAPGDPTRPPGG